MGSRSRARPGIPTGHSLPNLHLLQRSPTLRGCAARILLRPAQQTCRSVGKQPTALRMANLGGQRTVGTAAALLLLGACATPDGPVRPPCPTPDIDTENGEWIEAVIPAGAHTIRLPRGTREWPAGWLGWWTWRNGRVTSEIASGPRDAPITEGMYSNPLWGSWRAKSSECVVSTSPRVIRSTWFERTRSHMLGAQFVATASIQLDQGSWLNVTATAQTSEDQAIALAALSTLRSSNDARTLPAVACPDPSDPLASETRHTLADGLASFEADTAEIVAGETDFWSVRGDRVEFRDLGRAPWILAAAGEDTGREEIRCYIAGTAPPSVARVTSLEPYGRTPRRYFGAAFVPLGEDNTIMIQAELAQITVQGFVDLVRSVRPQ